MITANDVLRDGFGRVADELPGVVEGLTVEQLCWQPDPAANHIAWLVWHIGRCEDAQLAAIARRPEVYVDGWADRFGLPYDVREIGYQHTAAEVRAFVLRDPQLLVDYYAAVHAATGQILDGVADDELSQLVDDPYQVSVGTRIVSIINDITQHLGQASYLRGLLVRGSAADIAEPGN